MKKNLNVVIIGNGAAGTKAAQTIRELMPSSGVTIISNEDTPFYLRPQLVDFSSGHTTQKKIISKPPAFYSNNRINLLRGAEVLFVAPSKNQVLLSSKKKIGYDKLLIASGIRIDASRYKLRKEENIFSLKTLRDARVLKNKLPSLKEITVFGENILAFEFLRLLSSYPRLKVRYLIRKDRLWPEFFDKRLSGIIEGIFKNNNVELIYKSEVYGIIKNRSNFNIILKNKKELRADSIGIFEPLLPNLGFLKGTNVKIGDKGVFIDKNYMTSDKNIYAAGDAALRYGERDFCFVNSWQSAWQDGRDAAFSMAGKTIGRKNIRIISFRIFDKPYLSVGYTNPASSKEYEDIISPEGIDIYKKITLSKDLVRGAIFFGDVRNFAKIEELISKQTRLKSDEVELLRKIFEFYAEDEELRSLNLICPVCKAMLNFSDTSAAGDVTTCPVCGVELKVSLTEVSLIKRLVVA